jgi:ATP-binding cassette subfamily F protein uup
MPLVSINELTVGFRGPALLDQVSAQVEHGQKIGLLGRNGSGKTTFLKILAGELPPDHGEISFAPGAKVAMLGQEVPQDIAGPVREIIAAGLGPAAEDHEHAWQAERRVAQLITEMNLPGDGNFAALSSGMKRRVLLARALVSSPDLLLLDEPTNHLDIDAIAWLEDFLLRWPGTLMFVTHDRMFLRKLASRILEVDRGRLFDWSCDYDTFLVRKEQALAAEEKQDALFDKRLAAEEVWIRQGIKARRTRNEGRVRALEQMRRDRSQRRSAVGKVSMAIQEGERSGMLVAEVDDVSFSYGERPIVQNFSTSIMRGDKIGIVGPNGAGKTTLLRILLGQLAPQTGRVRLGTNLQVAYFDQLRGQLDEEQSVQHNVGDGYETIQFAGRPRHIIGYLKDFLFEPDRARTLVKFLSGGERNRVLLAKLFAKPANVIVLDEPTNDLDAETLEILEDLLVEFAGTVLLVSHDRAFLNNVVTSLIVFEGGNVREYVGGYDDWIRQRAAQAEDLKSAKNARKPERAQTREAAPASRAGAAATKPRRLSFKEKQELQSLPKLIEQREAELRELHEAMARPDFYQQPGPEIAARQNRLKLISSELETAYQRWEELEGAAE